MTRIDYSNTMRPFWRRRPMATKIRNTRTIGLALIVAAITMMVMS